MIGCGGLLVYVVIYLQFFGLLEGGFCVIEQGEIICYKFGMLKLVKCSLGIYVSVIIEVMLFLFLVLKEEWCEFIIIMVV